MADQDNGPWRDHTLVVDYNILSSEPTHRLFIWKEDSSSKEGGYWVDGYIYQGHVWGVVKPKVGHTIVTQHGNRYKIVRLGVEWIAWKGAQAKVAYAVPWNNK